MAQRKFIENQWVDIFPAPPPDEPWNLGLMLALLALSLCCIALFRYWYQRPRQQALRQLRQLIASLHLPETNYRACLFRLYAVLQHSLAGNRLDQLELDTKLLSDWHAFHSELRQRQYQRQAPDIDAVRDLLIHAQQWIKRIG